MFRLGNIFIYSRMSDAKDGLMVFDGKVLETKPNATFLVELENGAKIMAHTSGRIRNNKIKILLGDKVKVEVSVYDTTKGRVTYRY